MLPPLIVLLCAVSFLTTFSIGAFPSLLPEVARSARLPDWQLGLFAGAFGFARMVADLPVGLFIFRHLDRKSTRLNSSHIQKSRMPSSA